MGLPPVTAPLAEFLELPYTVRTFANGKLQADIDAALRRLEQIKPDAVAAVLVQADLEGAKIVVSRNKGPWTIAAIGAYEWKTRNLTAGAEVIWAI